MLSGLNGASKSLDPGAENGERYLMNTNSKTSVRGEGQRAMTSSRKTALAAGILYLLTFVSMPIGFLYRAVLSDPNYLVGPGTDTAVTIGAILEIIVAPAGIGTAAPLCTVLNARDAGGARGFVGS